MSTYLWVNLASISIPLIFSFHPRFPFYKEWKYFFPACLLTAIFFLVWDHFFTVSGVWGFNEKHLIGINWWQMPLEEYLFFFCIPYACVFTYFALTQLTKIPANPIPKLWILGIFFLIIGLASWGKAYPQVTFILLGLAWIIIDRIKFKYSLQFLIAYLLILLPFFLVNGVLTGSWITEEVVWYNDAENFGVRMGTIPVEDAFYAMLLLLMNIGFYEGFRKETSSLVV